MFFETMYKCRLCGETYAMHCTADRQVAVKSIIACLMNKTLKDGITPSLHEIHSCSNGNIGVADFLGIKETKE